MSGADRDGPRTGTERQADRRTGTDGSVHAAQNRRLGTFVCPWHDRDAGTIGGPEGTGVRERQYSEVMRSLFIALLPVVLSAAPALEIVRPIVSQMDGGAPEPAGFEHVAGETLWIMCRVAGYSKSEDEKVHLKYSVQAYDPKGIPLDEIYTNEIKAEVS